jgi:hypothetical protein
MCDLYFHTTKSMIGSAGVLFPGKGVMLLRPTVLCMLNECLSSRMWSTLSRAIERVCRVVSKVKFSIFFGAIVQQGRKW